MEAAVFTDSEIEQLMSQFVFIALYVDDRDLLDAPETVVENGSRIVMETKGEKWSYLQRMKFGANAQPYYVLLDNNGKPIAGAYAYNENVEKFKVYLENALKVYHSKNK